MNDSDVPDMPHIHRPVLSSFAGLCVTDTECCRGDEDEVHYGVGNSRWTLRSAEIKDRAGDGGRKTARIMRRACGHTCWSENILIRRSVARRCPTCFGENGRRHARRPAPIREAA